MLQRVNDRVSAHNNDQNVSNSFLKTNAKLIYYILFAKLYGFMGYFSDLVAVNSTWTKDHITNIWWNKNVKTIYPPCDVEKFLEFPLENRNKNILSIGQFRPEKDHKLQIDSFNLFLKKYPNWSDTKLILLGGCRDKEDEQRVKKLKDLVESLNISSKVEFVINATFEQKVHYLKTSLIGLHTMWNEHFGICIVEYQAAGLISLAHKSGGPLKDIIKHQQTGFLAENKEEYSELMNEILVIKDTNIQKNARESALRFSDQVFHQECVNYFKF